MDLRQKLILILTIIISLAVLIGINSLNIMKSESNSLRFYATGLEDYNAGKYSSAYKTFAKVSRYSVLKSVAIYRQAKSAENMNDSKLVIKTYKKLDRSYPDFALSVKVKYLLAQQIYLKDPQKSKSKFKKIVKKYPQSEYAIASQYYLGLIQIMELDGITNPTKLELDMQRAEEYFKAYLKEAPAGKFATASIAKLKELKADKLTSAENLIIARSYYTLGDFKSAKKYLMKTNSAYSWTDFVKNSYELKEYDKVRYFTELGLSNKNTEVNLKDTYKAIDLYLATSSRAKKDSINFLRNIAPNSVADDYLLYLNCQMQSIDNQPTCYNTLYSTYPKGQFSADALFNIFYANIKYQRYNAAKQLGKEHLEKFKNSNSSPAVMFWMGKLYEKTKNYEASRHYFKKVMEKFPDSYYSYRAYINMYKLKDELFVKDLVNKPVVFPYKKSKDGDLVIKLALLKDYSLVSEICKNDKFVQSWLAYQEENYAKSAILARDAMEKLEVKPSKNDFRWRLVYPIHYYDTIKEFSLNNNPIVLMSIVKEESHFNPKAISSVGARGLMQVMPQTATDVKSVLGLTSFDTNSLLETRTNLQVGALYYSQLKKMLKGKDFYVILAYNGGIGSVSSWKNYLNYEDKDDFLEQVPYSETQNYLKKVYRSYWNYARIYE